MSSLAPASLAVLLLLGPPSGEQPPVQSPKVSPTQPQPGDPAIAPAKIDSERATAEPAPGPEDPAGEPAIAPAETEPAPAETQPAETQPQPQPDGDLPSWQSEPVTPAGETGDQPVDEWGTPVEPEPDRGPPRGAGLYAAAGGLFGVIITRQWVTSLVCDDLYCGWRGNFDRALGLGVMGLAAGGGWLDGRRAAYLRHDAGEPPKRPTGRRAAGWTLFALGLGGLITDTVLYNLCYQQALGPYAEIEGFSYTCSPVISAVVTDFSTAFGAIGIGLGMSAESQLRARKKFDMSVAPWGGRGRVGLSLSGRF
jgi:hypothetical protein